MKKAIILMAFTLEAWQFEARATSPSLLEWAMTPQLPETHQNKNDTQSPNTSVAGTSTNPNPQSTLKKLSKGDAIASTVLTHEAILNSLSCANHSQLFIGYIQGLKNLELEKILSIDEFKGAFESASKNFCQEIYANKEFKVDYFMCKFHLRKRMNKMAEYFYSTDKIMPENLFHETFATQPQFPCNTQSYAHLMGISPEQSLAIASRAEKISTPQAAPKPDQGRVNIHFNNQEQDLGSLLLANKVTIPSPELPSDISAILSELKPENITVPEPPLPIAVPGTQNPEKTVPASPEKPQVASTEQKKPAEPTKPSPENLAPAPEPAHPAPLPPPQTAPETPLPAFVRPEEMSEGAAPRRDSSSKPKEEKKPAAPKVTNKKDSCTNGPLDWDKIISRFLAKANPEDKRKKRDFLRKMGALTEKVAKKNGIPMDGLLALMALESGWGTSELARKYNNFGGIKSGIGSGTTPLLATKERGRPTQDHFSSFKSHTDYMDEKIDFFVKNKIRNGKSYKSRYAECQSKPVPRSFQWLKCIGLKDYFNGTQAAQIQWAIEIEAIAKDLRSVGAVCL